MLPGVNFFSHISLKNYYIPQFRLKFKSKKAKIKSFMKKEMSHQETKSKRVTRKEMFSFKKSLVSWCPGGNNQ
jgi:hypothetical protein